MLRFLIGKYDENAHEFHQHLTIKGWETNVVFIINGNWAKSYIWTWLFISPTKQVLKWIRKKVPRSNWTDQFASYVRNLSVLVFFHGAIYVLLISKFPWSNNVKYLHYQIFYLGKENILYGTSILLIFKNLVVPWNENEYLIWWGKRWELSQERD